MAGGHGRPPEGINNWEDSSNGSNESIHHEQQCGDTAATAMGVVGVVVKMQG